MNQCIKIEKDFKGASQLVLFGEFLWAKSGRNPHDHEFSVRFSHGDFATGSNWPCSLTESCLVLN